MSTGLRFSEAEYQRMTKRMVVQPTGFATPKKAKYRNKPVEIDGERFDSKKEAKRAKELRMLLRAGAITWLAKQVWFHLPGQTVYIADFVYGVSLKVPGGGITSVTTVEDVKSDVTRKLQAYRIKARQMKAIHGIDVVEI